MEVARLTRFWDPGYYRTYLEQPGEPAGYSPYSRRSRGRSRAPRTFATSIPENRTPG